VDDSFYCFHHGEWLGGLEDVASHVYT
jgi:hypothetical protein